MLGDKVGESVGKTTNRRVIGEGKMEVSFEETGKLHGVDIMNYGTYEAVMCGKHLDGTGRGIIMTPDGETVTWTATGIGNFTGKGQGVAWRGSLHYQTTSQKLARVNGTCYLFEYDIDESGNNSKGRISEWK